MEHENDSLYKRKKSRQESVEKGDEENDRDSKQSSVPPLVDVAVVVENDEALDLGRRQKASNRHAALPSKCAEPTDEGEESLLAPRCELGDPVVLAACRSVSLE